MNGLPSPLHILPFLVTLLWTSFWILLCSRYHVHIWINQFLLSCMFKVFMFDEPQHFDVLLILCLYCAMLFIPFYDPLPMLVLALLPTFDGITSHVGIHDMFVCNQDSLNLARCKKPCKTTWKVMQDDVIRSFIAMTCEKLHVLLLLWHYYECGGFCGHWSNGVWTLISYEPKDNGGKLWWVISTKKFKIWKFNHLWYWIINNLLFVDSPVNNMPHRLVI